MKLLTVIQSSLLLFVLATAINAQTRQKASLSRRVQQLEPFIVASAQRYGVDSRILRGLCFIESRYRINAVSSTRARGPMQFMPGTAERYGLRDPHQPQAAIDAAARYLRDLLKRFGGRIDLALAAYVAGEGAVISFMTGKPLILRSGRIVNPQPANRRYPALFGNAKIRAVGAGASAASRFHRSQTGGELH